MTEPFALSPADVHAWAWAAAERWAAAVSAANDELIALAGGNPGRKRILAEAAAAKARVLAAALDALAAGEWPPPPGLLDGP
jgi:hypothetical protein